MADENIVLIDNETLDLQNILRKDSNNPTGYHQVEKRVTALEANRVRSDSIDGVTITQTGSSNSKYEVVATKHMNNSGLKYDWIGTISEYNTQKTSLPNSTVCFITED